ncbi:hypothetical protein BU17DRAFT_91583 [Hysterangium stoloniferum]|nr:hypothetical protein BU17DRAFT_91583 [Hysterangium stoloniferum]
MVKSPTVSEYLVASGGYSHVWTGISGKKKVAIKATRGFASHGMRIQQSELLQGSLLILGGGSRYGRILVVEAFRSVL